MAYSLVYPGTSADFLEPSLTSDGQGASATVVGQEQELLRVGWVCPERELAVSRQGLRGVLGAGITCGKSGVFCQSCRPDIALLIHTLT